MAMIDCLLVNAAIADWRKAAPTADLFKLGCGFDAHFANSLGADGFYTASTYEDREVSIINFRAFDRVYYNRYWLNRFGTAAA